MLYVLVIQLDLILLLQRFRLNFCGHKTDYHLQNKRFLETIINVVQDGEYKKYGFDISYRLYLGFLF